MQMRVNKISRPRGRTAGAEMIRRLGRTKPRSFTLHMAPMIDVIFLLLLFFLVAAKWRPAENFLPFNAAAAGAGLKNLGKPEPLLIQIDSTDDGCRVNIGGLNAVDVGSRTIEQDMATLMNKTADCLAEQNRYPGDPVEIYCAAQVKADYWVKIYNIFYGMGLTDITFVMAEQGGDDYDK